MIGFSSADRLNARLKRASEERSPRIASGRSSRLARSGDETGRACYRSRMCEKAALCHAGSKTVLGQRQFPGFAKRRDQSGDCVAF